MLAKILEYLAMASLALSAVQAYLIVNKVWRRKHERAVSESQSIVSNLLGLFTGFPWVLKYVLDGEIKSALVSGIWFLLTVFFTLVAIGFWVPATHKEGLWTKVRRALQLERTEAAALAKAFFRPTGGTLILRILQQVAAIDDEIDQRERQFIEDFARSWGIDFDPTAATAGGLRFTELHRAVQDYLAIAPPHAQVAQLTGVLESLVKIDDAVSEEEALIMKEVLQMLGAYVAGDAAIPAHHVILVPQNAAQDESIRSLVATARPISYRGGTAYLAGTYHSTDFANVVRDRYRALNFFTLVDTALEPNEAADEALVRDAAE